MLMEMSRKEGVEVTHELQEIMAIMAVMAILAAIVVTMGVAAIMA